MTAVTLVRELDRLYLQAQRSADPDDWLAYLVAKRAVNRMLNGEHATVEIDLGCAEPDATVPDTAPAPNVARRPVSVRLRAFWHAVAIRFRSRVGLTVRGSGS